MEKDETPQIGEPWFEEAVVPETPEAPPPQPPGPPPEPPGETPKRRPKVGR